MRLLFVENHQVFAQVVRERFLAAHEVVIVPTLAGAREALARGKFDAVLVDFELDDGEGVALVSELHDAGSPTPTIGVSAKEECNQRLLTAGAVAAVTKLELQKIGDVLDRLPSHPSAGSR